MWQSIWRNRHKFKQRKLVFLWRGLVSTALNAEKYLPYQKFLWGHTQEWRDSKGYHW